MLIETNTNICGCGINTLWLNCCVMSHMMSSVANELLC